MKTFGAVIFAAVITMSPAVADMGQATPTPVEIDSCSYVHNHDESRYGVRISYQNVTTKTADEVRFLVWWHGLGPEYAFHLRDVGKFSPNVEIVHTFAGPSNVFASGFDCLVQRIHFSDGTTWQAPLED